ncbi:hypothetical protein WJX73_006316 [Symbiochloris irregularis]|uniref:Uncharacterized protein n=1 Tax=Symbiochloris irregularis TaxID=706552 RepID=A0AAW1NF52_9CHLO
MFPSNHSTWQTLPRALSTSANNFPERSCPRPRALQASKDLLSSDSAATALVPTEAHLLALDGFLHWRYFAASRS